MSSSSSAAWGALRVMSHDVNVSADRATLAHDVGKMRAQEDERGAERTYRRRAPRCLFHRRFVPEPALRLADGALGTVAATRWRA